MHVSAHHSSPAKTKAGLGLCNYASTEMGQFNVIELCPEPLTVPIGVEAVWALISPKNYNPRNEIQHIAICSYYYSGPKATSKDLLFDHIAEAYHLLTAKYGPKTHFMLSADSNRLNLSPILNLSPNLKQVVKVPTRLNPEATLDTIITTLAKYYKEPTTKPPISKLQIIPLDALRTTSQS